MYFYIHLLLKEVIVMANSNNKRSVAFVTLRMSVCISKYDLIKPMWL